MPARIAHSDRRSADTGSFIPWEMCTIDIASSTLTPCGPPACRSVSVRARQGRISACWPCTMWLRFSLVATCTVRSQFCSASNMYGVSGAASARLPPRLTNTFTLPSCIASIARATSSPCSRGGSIWHTSASRSRNCWSGRWLIPNVRLPCTLLWPRTGHGPAPSRPMLPRSSIRLTISRTVSTPCSCCVTPRHQAMITRPDFRYESASLRIAASSTPEPRTSSLQGVASHSARYSSRPCA